MLMNFDYNGTRYMGINYSFIVLIPKNRKARDVMDFSQLGFRLSIKHRFFLIELRKYYQTS